MIRPIRKAGSLVMRGGDGSMDGWMDGWMEEFYVLFAPIEWQGQGYQTSQIVATD